MNCRIFESVSHALVLAPVSVEPSTLTPTTAFVDMQTILNVDFVVSTAAMESGKKLHLELWGADDAAGSENARKLAEVDHVLGESGPVLAIISYRVQAQNPRYIGVKLQHDAGAGVVCAVVAESGGCVRPAPSGSSCTLVV